MNNYSSITCLHADIRVVQFLAIENNKFIHRLDCLSLLKQTVSMFISLLVDSYSH